MKKKLLFCSILAAAAFWALGTWLDGLSNEARLKKDSDIAAWKERVASLREAPLIAYRDGEVSYAECDRHLFNFMFFLDNGSKDQAGEERDLASRSCQAAYDRMSAQSQSKNGNERFHAFYALGNINVRRAMLAVSQDEQKLALKEAVDSYIAALQVKDDYQAKFNLELLLSINKDAAGDGSKKPSPHDLKLSPKPNGAAPGVRGKSKL